MGGNGLRVILNLACIVLAGSAAALAGSDAGAISDLSLTLPGCVPGWTGSVLIGCENTSGWGIECDSGSSGTLAVTEGVVGNALRLNWDIGAGSWVQARYTFRRAMDLSREDLFGVSLRGDAGIANQVAFMFADADGVFYGFDCSGLSNVDRWMINLSLPKKMFWHFFTFGPDTSDRTIDWSRIQRFYVVVKRPAALQGGGSGTLAIDHVQSDRACDWPRQAEFEPIEPNQASVDKAVSFILGRRTDTGLFTSWSSETVAYAYDQGLVLMVLAREGLWEDGLPRNGIARAADKLAGFLVAHQLPGGNWPTGWDGRTGEVAAGPGGVGNDCYVAMGLVTYANKSGDLAARRAAERCGDWLAGQIDGLGRLIPSTEGNVDSWWAMAALGRWEEAGRIQHYLLNTVWDADLRYWWRGYGESPDPVIAMDCATWVGEFAKSPRVNRPDMAKAALSFVRRTLMTTDHNYARCGLDGMGPIGLWCEGMAQYVSAGGEGAQAMLDTLLSLQYPDGGMPGSTEDRSGCFGWLTTMTGLAPTCWLYFAQTGSPFADLIPPEETGGR